MFTTQQQTKAALTRQTGEGFTSGVPHMDFCSRCREELALHNSRSPGSLPYFEEELFHLSIPHHSSVDVDNEPSMSHSTLNSLLQQINVLLSSHGKSIADPMESQLLYLLFQIEGE
jgi:hypothetical protein